MMIEIEILAEKLDVQLCIQKAMCAACGGINIFIGTVRNTTKNKKVICLEFEAYEKMALQEMQKIATHAQQQWEVQNIIIHHRSGILQTGEIPVVIVVSAAHRAAAFDACRYIIDTLKQKVPIWKKEIFLDGEEWVEAHP